MATIPTRMMCRYITPAWTILLMPQAFPLPLQLTVEFLFEPHPSPRGSCAFQDRPHFVRRRRLGGTYGACRRDSHLNFAYHLGKVPCLEQASPACWTHLPSSPLVALELSPRHLY